MDLIDELLESFYSEENKETQLSGLESFNCESLYELAITHGDVGNEVVSTENED